MKKNTMERTNNKFNVGDLILLYWSGMIKDYHTYEEDMEVIEILENKYYVPALAIIVGTEYNIDFGKYYKIRIIIEDKMKGSYPVAYKINDRISHLIHEETLERKAKICWSYMTKQKMNEKTV
jgi:hypothetical protein